MKQKQKYMALMIIALLAVSVFAATLPMTVISVSSLNIDPQGYEDPNTHEWTGSFWSVEMLVDVDDQVAGFHLANDDGTPEGTYVEAGNEDGTSEKQYVTDSSVGTEQLIPTADVMVHVTPYQPYYERPLEIDQGYYVKEAWSRESYGLFGWSGQIHPIATAVPFVHSIFGSGSWELHTPFLVVVYKEGVEIGRRDVDTIGKTGIYRIPAEILPYPNGDDFITVLDLGKIQTGYGEPQWDDIIYFSENDIFVRSVTADTLLKYDGGELPVPIMDSVVGGVSASCFSTYWYGNQRWMSDATPTVTSLYNLTPGWEIYGNTAEPIRPTVFGNVVPYLQSKGIPKVTMPSWLDRIEKTEDDNLRLYLPYGSASSWVTLKISTELADTIIWQPQVANFMITDFPDFGDILDSVTGTITIQCVAGTGSATVSLVKTPSDIPASFSPSFGTPVLAAGESHKITFSLLNLGTPTDEEFSVTASVTNSLGSVTDTATAYGTLKVKTGETTILHVLTRFDNKPINGIPVVIAYSGLTKAGLTNTGGAGLVTFNLQTSSTVYVDVSYTGNAIYKPISKNNVRVDGGSEQTVYLFLVKHDPEAQDWTLYLVIAAVGIAVVATIYLTRKKKR